MKTYEANMRGRTPSPTVESERDKFESKLRPILNGDKISNFNMEAPGNVSSPITLMFQ